MKVWQKIIIPVIVVIALFTVIITGTILNSVQTTLVNEGYPKIDLVAQVRNIIDLLLIVGILGLAVIIFVINFFVVSRFVKFAENVKEIGEKHDLSMRLKEDNKDEIGILARAINSMLDKIASSEKAERESNTKTLAATEELRLRNDELEKMNKLMVDRELKMIELKQENKKLKAQVGT